MQEWLRAIDQSRASGAGFGKAGDIYNSARHDFDQQMAGRPPAGDWVDTASNVLAPRDSSIGGEPPEQAECFSQSQFVRTLLLDEPERCISQSRTDPPTTAMSTRHQLFMTLVFATILAPVPRAR